MPFDDLETGLFTGKPVRLFVFTRQTKVWRFNSSSEDLELGGDTFLGANIERDEIRETVERAKDKLKIRMAYLLDPNASMQPTTQSLGDLWALYIPSSPVYVTCMSAHIGEAETTFDWTGQVMQPAFDDKQLELVCEPTDGRQYNRNQGARWQRSCWKTVFSTGLRGCNLDPEPIAINATVSAVSGNDITADEFVDPPRSFVGGTVTWDDGGPQSANITAHSGDTITVDDAGGLVASDDVFAHTIPIYIDATLTVVNGLQLTAPEFSNALFNLAGGSLTWTDVDGVVERRLIMTHDDDAITVLYGAADFAVDLDVRATPNCPRNWAACDARNNTINYGGAIYKPTKNPLKQSRSWG